MPRYWTRLPSSPPEERRDEVAKIASENGGELVAHETYYDENGDCWALIDVPGDADKQKKTLRDLGAFEWKGLVTAAEKNQGKPPPPSGRKS